MSLIGRDQEIKELRSFIDSQAFAMALVYGRHGTGKSALISHCLSNYRGKARIIQVNAVAGSREANIASLNEATRMAFPELASQSFDSFDAFLCFLFDQSKREKVVLAIDQYPSFSSSMEEASDLLLRYSDRYGDRDIKIILAGSPIGKMEELLNYSSSIYGRFRLVMKVKPLDYFDAAKFVPHYSKEDQFRTYAVFGGSPSLLRHVDDSLTIEENIQRLFVSSSSPMQTEFYSMINEAETIDDGLPVLKTLSNADLTFEELEKCIGLLGNRTAHLGNAIRELIDASLINKLHRIGDSSNNPESVYQWSENALLFWASYCERDQRRDGLFKEFFDKWYLPRIFKTVCREYLIRINRSVKCKPPFTNLGLPPYQAASQIDLVAKGDGGFAYFKCIYGDKPISQDCIRKWKKSIDQLVLRPGRLCLFSNIGFDHSVELKECKTCVLEDLYSID